MDYLDQTCYSSSSDLYNSSPWIALIRPVIYLHHHVHIMRWDFAADFVLLGQIDGWP
jgi:hypothetical protein